MVRCDGMDGRMVKEEGGGRDEGKRIVSLVSRCLLRYGSW